MRHGQYTLTDTDETSILTDIGRQQAAATGRRLAELSNNGAKIDRVVVSTMARAKETADIILEHLPAAPSPEFCDLIREGAVYVTSSFFGCSSVEKTAVDGLNIQTFFFLVWLDIILLSVSTVLLCYCLVSVSPMKQLDRMFSLTHRFEYNSPS